MNDNLTHTNMEDFKGHTPGLPENSKPVLAWVKAMNGTLIPCIAQHTKGWDLEIDAEDLDDTINFDEKAEKAFMKEGWYENCEQHQGTYDFVYIKRDVVKWVDIAAAPDLLRQRDELAELLNRATAALEMEGGNDELVLEAKTALNNIKEQSK